MAVSRLGGSCVRWTARRRRWWRRRSALDHIAGERCVQKAASRVVVLDEADAAARHGVAEDHRTRLLAMTRRERRPRYSRRPCAPDQPCWLRRIPEGPSAVELGRQRVGIVRRGLLVAGDRLHAAPRAQATAALCGVRRPGNARGHRGFGRGHVVCKWTELDRRS